MEGKKAYSDREKVLLAALVREHGAQIENKKTDGSSIQGKTTAWEIITDLYNMQPESNCKRSAKQLKKLWENMKQRKRKEVTAQKHYRLLTGGGPQQEIPADPLMELIDDAAPFMDVNVFCPWDSTASYEESNSNTKVVTAVSTSATPVASTSTALAASTNGTPTSSNIYGGWVLTAAVPTAASTSGAPAASRSVTAASTSGTQTSSSTVVRSLTAAFQKTRDQGPPAASGTPPKSLAASAPISSMSSRKRARTDAEDERHWRVLKAKESVFQQRELHKIRMQAANAEAELATLKLNMFKMQNNL